VWRATDCSAHKPSISSSGGKKVVSAPVDTDEDEEAPSHTPKVTMAPEAVVAAKQSEVADDDDATVEVNTDATVEVTRWNLRVEILT